MDSITSVVSLWYRPCFKNVKLWQQQQMPKQQQTFENIKVLFPWLQNKYWPSLRALTCLEKLRTCLQISNKLYNNVLVYS